MLIFKIKWLSFYSFIEAYKKKSADPVQAQVKSKMPWKFNLKTGQFLMHYITCYCRETRPCLISMYFNSQQETLQNQQIYYYLIN